MHNKPHSEETKRRLSLWRKGKTYKQIHGKNAEKVRKKLSFLMSGEKHHQFGKPVSLSTKAKISLSIRTLHGTLNETDEERKLRQYKYKLKNKLKNIELYRKIHAEYQKRYTNNYSEVINAQVLAGKIPLDIDCNICHSKINLQRHHWRYDKPLLINTLCGHCHLAQHGKKLRMVQY
jgi:hypothetical protein